MLEIKIDLLEIGGVDVGLKAMRNPMNSWDRAGEVEDGELSKKLCGAGSEHSKHLRLMNIAVEIEAPRYWWQEFDTYRVGVEKISCSTMHKLLSRDLVLDDFSYEPECEYEIEVIENVIEKINEIRARYLVSGDSEDLLRAKRLLLESYRQKRTVVISMQALYNIVCQRRSHRLTEWGQFCKWAEGLGIYKYLIS